MKPLAIHGARLKAPRMWVTFLREFMDIDERLAVELWQELYPSERHPLSLALARLRDLRGRDDAIMNWRALLRPTLLLELCCRVSPEDGRRRRDVIQTEEKILERTGPDGQWL